MKIVRTVVFVVITLMSITAGMPKILMVPAEVGFFEAAGMGTVPLVLLGSLQVAGGALMIMRTTRTLGAALAATGLLASTIVLLMAGNTGFAAVSLVPALLAVAIVIYRLRTAPGSQA